MLFRGLAYRFLVPRGVVQILVVAAVLFVPGIAGAASLRADYQFDGSLSSSVGNSPSMTNINTVPGQSNAFATETVDGVFRRVLRFPQGNGLQVSTAGVVPATSYTIVVDFRFVSTSGYRRILDLKAGTSDNGLYALNGALTFYNIASSTSTPITPSAGGDPYHEVALIRRTTGQVTGYVDGVERFTFDDTTGDAVIDPAKTLIFFRDDMATPGEESAGAVSEIRLYDGPVVPLPPPVLGKSVNVTPVSGTVLVKNGNRFVPLMAGRQVTVGSTLDTRRGTVELTSASSKSSLSSGLFEKGVFTIRQSRSRSAGGVTNLVLADKGLRGSSCLHSRAPDIASAAVSSRTIQLLRARVHGRFRTTGRYSAATVRGTDYTVADRCNGTLTTVKRGVVLVHDFRTKRTITVRTGHSYLARSF